MEVKMAIRSAKRQRWWWFDMGYEGLPPDYVSEIVAVAKSFEQYIENTAGQAVGQDPAYTVEFSFKAEGEELAGVSAPAIETYRGRTSKGGFLYSQAVGFQDAGLKLLAQLQTGAHREIASGQRK